MSDSLVERLRAHADWHYRYGAQASVNLLREAADRIEADAERIDKLEEALRKVRGHTSCSHPTMDLLTGLLRSIERITDAALKGPEVPHGEE